MWESERGFNSSIGGEDNVSKEGKMAVYEACDGAGKSIQAKLLMKYCEENDIDYAYIHFPRTQDECALFGQLVGSYLNGGYKETNPYFISTLYANDRLMAKEKLEGWLDEGKLVIVDRYIYSALAIQGCQLDSTNFHAGKMSDRDKFYNWLWDYEFNQNEIPKPDIVLYLDVPMSFIEKNLSERNGKREKEGKIDIHEKIDFQRKIRSSYYELNDMLGEFNKVKCDIDGEIQSPEDIFESIKYILNQEGILDV